MNQGVLQFSLGLATGAFSSGISKASALLKGFSAAVLGIGSIMGGVMSAIDKGSSLEQLHRRTGASISSLYELQKGFQAAGLSADDVSDTLFKMQKSLGGVNELGESTPDIFKKLGLSIQGLEQMDAPQQINAIMQGLSKLDTSAAASAAEGIFGRYAAANIIQLSHSTKEFSSAIADSVEQAKNMQRIAPILNEVHLLIVKVKNIATGMFAGIAVGLAPALEMGLKFLNSFKSTLTAIGNGIGRIFSGMTEAFREGKIGELMNLTFAASVEFLVNAIANTLGSGSFWMGIFDVLVGSAIRNFAIMWKIFATMGEAVIAGLDTMFQKLFAGIGKTALGKKLGLGGYEAETFSKNFSDVKKKGQGGMDVLDSVLDTGLALMTKGVGKMGSAILDAMKNSGGAEQNKLKNFWSGITARTPALPKSADTTPGSGNLSTEKYVYRPEASELNKMGFIGGGANPSQEYARRTADGVMQMVGLMQTTVQLLTGGPGQTNQI